MLLHKIASIAISEISQKCLSIYFCLDVNGLEHISRSFCHLWERKIDREKRLQHFINRSLGVNLDIHFNFLDILIEK